MKINRRNFLISSLSIPFFSSQNKIKYLDELEEYSVKTFPWNPIELTNYVKSKFDLKEVVNQSIEELEIIHTGAKSINGNFIYSIFGDSISEKNIGFSFIYDQQNDKAFGLDSDDKNLSGVNYDEFWPIGLGDNGVSCYALIKGIENNSHVYNVDAFVIADIKNKRKTIISEKKKWEEWKILGFDESEQRGVLLSGNGEKMIVYTGKIEEDNLESINYNIIDTLNFQILKNGQGLVKSIGYNGEITLA